MQSRPNPQSIDDHAPGSDVPRGEGVVPGQTIVTARDADGLGPEPPRGEQTATRRSGADGEAYLDIVWKQFCRNRPALWSLASLIPVLGVAIFAPLIALNMPFVYSSEQEGLVFPWFRYLFNPSQTVDFVFNMAMVGFPIWLVIAAVYNGLAKKRRRSSGRVRALVAMGLYAAVTAGLSVLFAIPSWVPPSWGMNDWQPDNRFFARSFPEEELRAREAGERVWSIYPPIPFGPEESDSIWSMQPPLKPRPPRQGSEDPMYARVTAESPHWLGTDATGKDVLTKMIFGTRIAVSVGVLAVGLYCLIGIILGALAGYFGGWTDVVISRMVEVVIVFPTFFLILTLVALTDQQSVFLVMLVIGLTGWTTIARLVRGDVLKQRSMEYVLGAKSLGARSGRIIFRHILPNAFSSVLVAVPFGVGGAILIEADLSLLGFGVKVPNPSWGELLNQGRTNFDKWWLIVFPGLAIFLTMTIFNLIGSGLRDAADPRLRGH